MLEGWGRRGLPQSWVGENSVQSSVHRESAREREMGKYEQWQNKRSAGGVGKKGIATISDENPVQNSVHREGAREKEMGKDEQGCDKKVPVS